MNYEEIGAVVFTLLSVSPGVIVGLALPFVDIRYGNTYLLGAFFDRTLYRDEHPFWFWLVEAVQIMIAVIYILAIIPDLAERLFTLI